MPRCASGEASAHGPGELVDAAPCALCPFHVQARAEAPAGADVVDKGTHDAAEAPVSFGGEAGRASYVDTVSFGQHDEARS